MLIRNSNRMTEGGTDFDFRLWTTIFRSNIIEGQGLQGKHDLVEALELFGNQQKENNKNHGNNEQNIHMIEKVEYSVSRQETKEQPLQGKKYKTRKATGQPLILKASNKHQRSKIIIEENGLGTQRKSCVTKKVKSQFFYLQGREPQKTERNNQPIFLQMKNRLKNFTNSNQKSALIVEFLHRLGRDNLAEIALNFFEIYQSFEGQNFNQFRDELIEAVSRINGLIGENFQRWYRQMKINSFTIEASTQCQNSIIEGQPKNGCIPRAGWVPVSDEQISQSIQMKIGKEVKQYEQKMEQILEAVYKLKRTIEQLQQKEEKVQNSFFESQNTIQDCTTPNIKGIQDRTQKQISFERSNRHNMEDSLQVWKSQIQSLISSIKTKKNINAQKQVFNHPYVGRKVRCSKFCSQSNQKLEKPFLSQVGDRIIKQQMQDMIEEEAYRRAQDKISLNIDRIYKTFKKVYKFTLQLLFLFSQHSCEKKLRDLCMAMYNRYKSIHIKRKCNCVNQKVQKLYQFMDCCTEGLDQISSIVF